MSTTYYLAALIPRIKFYESFQNLFHYNLDINKYPDKYITSWNLEPTDKKITSKYWEIISEIQENGKFTEDLIKNETLSVSLNNLSDATTEFQLGEQTIGIEFSNSLQEILGERKDLFIYLVYENSSRFFVNNHHLSRFLMQRILSILDAKYAWTISESQIDAMRYEKNPFSEIESVMPWLIPSRTKVFHKDTLSRLGSSIYELEKNSGIYRKDVIDDKIVWLSGPFGLENERNSISELKYGSDKMIKYDDRYLSNLLSLTEENHHTAIENFINQFKY